MDKSTNGGELRSGSSPAVPAPKRIHKLTIYLGYDEAGEKLESLIRNTYGKDKLSSTIRELIIKSLPKSSDNQPL